ncbi:MAG: NUDIX domain-containing protein [Butyrivibrio sp.]|nr:NUDIX domain-containing protein [Butyrivibrio sp.]MBQ8031534.1 NUDIX domain-containing protein [Butyrivibrio sp.]MBR1642807.1 NUDIX domain-containing protein [Butyrivibrio sp.]
MEYLDIVDENGNPTGETVERSYAHQNGVWHRTSHVWILRKREGKIEVLLQKRADTKSFPGCYDISSAGHITAGQGFLDSAVRELGEELGITATEDELLFCGDRKIIWDDVFFGEEYHDRQFTKVFLLWADVDEKSLTLQEEEVSAVKWMDLDECIEGVKANAFKHCILPEELEMVKKRALA